MALILNGDTGASMVQDNVVNPVTDIVKNIPCFSAYRTANQAYTTNVAQKVQFNLVDFDTTNAYDETTNHRFQPLVTGYYHISAAVGAQTIMANQGILTWVYKNNTSKEINGCLSNTNTTNYPISTISGIVYLNGSTDYIEIIAQINFTGSVATGTTSQCKFQAHLIVGA